MVLTELVDPAVARTTRAADPIAVRSTMATMALHKSIYLLAYLAMNVSKSVM